MSFIVNEHLPENFHPESRVWIYQSNRLFTMTEAFEIGDILNEFAENWQSHGAGVKGFATLFFGRFVIFMADETQTGVSGCSTDSSVRVVKMLEQKFGVDFFNRQLLAFYIKEKVEMIPLQQFSYAMENGLINKDTIYFNNVVLTRQQLENNWMVPVKDSWLKSRIKHQGVN